jgi:hypothetical protein
MKINGCNNTVRPFSFMPAKQGAPGEGQDEGIKNQARLENLWVIGEFPSPKEG